MSQFAKDIALHCAGKLTSQAVGIRAMPLCRIRPNMLPPEERCAAGRAKTHICIPDRG